MCSSSDVKQNVVINSYLDNPRTIRRAAAFGGSTIAAACFLFLLFAEPTPGQFIGDVSLQTVTQTLFPAGTTCTGSPQTATINNLGQTSHSIVLLQGSTATSIKFFLEGSNDGVNFTRISDEYDGILTGQLQASGYNTVVRANVQCSPGTATFGLSYSGSGIPQALPAGDGLRSQVEKVLAQGISTTGNQNFGLRAPYGNTAGLLQFTTSGGSFSGTAAATVTCTLLSGTNTTVLASTTLSGTTQLITIPASPCVSPLVGYTQGTSTGNMTIEYIFSAGFAGAGGTSSTSLTSTTGCVADGTSTATCNPIVIGGKTSPGSSSPGVAKFATVLGENANDLSVGNYNVLGLAVGAGNVNPQGNFTGVTAPNVGPMVVAAHGIRPDLSTGTTAPITSTTAQGGAYGVTGAGIANNSLPGLMVNNNGFAFLNTATSITASGNVPVELSPSWNYGVHDECRVSVTTGTPTGTAPTLDVYFQDSLDGTNFSDRVHFTQITTTASTQKQTAAVSAITVNGVTPLTTAPIQIQSQTIAAATIVNGPIAGWLRFSYVIGGSASPTFPSTQFGVVCH
jgi:hypothetical protein